MLYVIFYCLLFITVFSNYGGANLGGKIWGGKIESGKIEGGEMRVAYKMRLAKCGWQNRKW